MSSEGEVKNKTFDFFCEHCNERVVVCDLYEEEIVFCKAHKLNEFASGFWSGEFFKMHKVDKRYCPCWIGGDEDESTSNRG